MRSHKFFIACAGLCAAGILLAAAGTAAGGFVSGVQLNAKGLQVYAPKLLEKSGKALYEEKEAALEPFDSIEIQAEYADIRLEASDAGQYGISYCVEAQAGIRYEVKDGKLLVRQGSVSSNASWFHNIAWFSFGSGMPFVSGSEAKKEFVTVHVPKNKKFALISLQADSGDAACENIQSDSFHIEADYGNVRLKEIQAKELGADMDSGNLKMQQVAAGTCRLRNEYGDFAINGLKLAGDMRLEAESGDIQMQDAQIARLQLDSSYGSVAIRQSDIPSMQLSLDSENCVLSDVAFENCRIKSEYGNVRMELKEPAEAYGYQLNTEYGEITIDGNVHGESYASLEKQKKNIEVQCESGDIEIEGKK